MSAVITRATYEAVDEIAYNLRELDYLELAATSISDNPGYDLANRVMRFSVAAFVAYWETRPAACWGLLPLWPGVGMAYAFGTDEWSKVLLPMTKHVGRFMLPYLLDNGYHRIECRSLASREDTRRWLTLFGATPEAVMRSSGKRGEDFILYVWLKDEYRPAAKAEVRTTAH